MSSARRHITPHTLVRLLGDWREGPGPIYARLSRRLAQLLSDGRVAPGVRLPSERGLADELSVSRTTVVRTYGVLREHGLLESRRGAGSVTRLSARSVDRFNAWSGAGRLEASVLPLVDLSKASPLADEWVIAALQDAASQAAILLNHHGYHPLGLQSLRAAIARRYELRGVRTAPEQILVTAGAQQAIDLLLRTFVRTRETVVVESPTYPGAMDSLRLAGARMVSLDVSTEPWQLEALETLLIQTGARLAYLMPDFHNPTGRFMGDEQRKELVRLCRRHAVMLIVDETLAEVRLDPREAGRPVAAHDPADAVISIGSLSKAIWGGLRIGWVRASPRHVAALAATRTAADLGGAPIEQLAATSLLATLDEYLETRKEAVLSQRDTVVAAVRRLGWEMEVPSGGLSAWVRLPVTSSSLLADAAYRHGIVLIPGPRLSPDGALDRYLRLPYSLSADTLEAALERLASAWDGLVHVESHDRVLQVV